MADYLPWLPVPTQLWRQPDLLNVRGRVLFAMNALSPGGECFASHETIATLARCTAREVRRSQGQLQSLGYLVAALRRRKTLHWTIADHARAHIGRARKRTKESGIDAPQPGLMSPRRGTPSTDLSTERARRSSHSPSTRTLLAPTRTQESYKLEEELDSEIDLGSDSVPRARRAASPGDAAVPSADDLEDASAVTAAAIAELAGAGRRRMRGLRPNLADPATRKEERRQLVGQFVLTTRPHGEWERWCEVQIGDDEPARQAMFDSYDAAMRTAGWRRAS